MHVRTTFLKRDLEEEIYMDQPKGFSIEKRESTWCESLRNQYINLNKLFDNIISSLMIPLLTLNLRKTLLTSLYI